jgi:hypothetical protein
MGKNLEPSPIKGAIHEIQKDINVYKKVDNFSIYL